MDVQKVIGSNYEMSDTGGIRIAKCKQCGKQIVLRSGSSAVTRLFSHVATQHGGTQEALALVTKK